MRQNRRARKRRTMFPLWPDEKGILQLPDERETKGESTSAKSQNAPSESPSPRLPRSRRVPAGKITQLRSLLSSRLWLYLRSRIIYSFEVATRQYFSLWLRGKLSVAEYGALTVASVMEDAREDLAIRDDVILALITQLTREGAEFRSIDGILMFRSVS